MPRIIPQKRFAKFFLRGFSILEMLVVLAVISILIGLVFPNFQRMRELTKLTRAQAETKTIKVAVESAYVNKRIYPAASLTPVAAYFGNDTWLNTSPATPKIISTPLDDPYTSAVDEYYYVVGTTSQASNFYVICSRGPNGNVNVTAAEINSGPGILTTAEIEDDICATNGTFQ